MQTPTLQAYLQPHKTHAAARGRIPFQKCGAPRRLCVLLTILEKVDADMLRVDLAITSFMAALSPRGRWPTAKHGARSTPHAGRFHFGTVARRNVTCIQMGCTIVLI